MRKPFESITRNSIKMEQHTSYRKLIDSEIATLQQQGCRANDWQQVEITDGTDLAHITGVTFSGSIRIGTTDKCFELPGGLRRHSGLRNATLHNVTIGDNCLIENIRGYIANYNIGNDTHICNIDTLAVDGRSSFGNGIDVSVLNETGGREVMMHDRLSAHQAYFMALYRHRPTLIRNMREIISEYASRVNSETGTVGSHVVIADCGELHNLRIGDYCSVIGAARLVNGSINSVREAPVTIGRNVICVDFIISSGSSVTDGAMLTRCFVGQACTIGHGYSASESLFFGNCQEENGEACAVFAGPFTVTHHKSTLLIASQFSFMNAGSGSNQSNHMYKLGPIHQGSMERGAKTSSNSYILWPARIGAFSLVMGRHADHPDTSDLPFSYLIEHENMTYLYPAINLRSVGTIRDARKWPMRDKRTDPHRLDQINYNLLSPYTIQKMMNGCKILKDLQHLAGETSVVYSYQSTRIKNSALVRGLELYDMAINKFLGNSIIKRLEGLAPTCDDDIRRRLKPDTETGLGDWCDLSGLIAPKSEVLRLIDDIEQQRVTDVDGIHDRFAEMHANYYRYEWTWAFDKILRYYKLDADRITAADVIGIVQRWKTAVVGIDNLVYNDAKKEFSLSSMTGFGVDGDRTQQIEDFEQVRGVFERDPSVQSILDHIRVKTALGDSVIATMQQAL